MIPDYRTALNPNFTVREANEILQYLKKLVQAEGISSTKYGTQILNFERDPRYIALRVNENIPPYSILLVEGIINVTTQFFQPMVIAEGFLATETKNPLKDIDKHRYIYCTNGSNAIIFSSSSSQSSSFNQSSSSSSSRSSSSSESQSGMMQCHIIGTHRPHIVRVLGGLDLPYLIGDRLDICTDGSGRVKHSPIGPFTCLSGQDDRGLVWMIAHHHQLSYIPWVRTIQSNGVYPTSPANVFSVRRGTLQFDDTSPGLKSMSFISATQFPGLAAETFTAISPCGWIPENSIRRMTLDNGKYYLVDDCSFVAQID